MSAGAIGGTAPVVGSAAPDTLGALNSGEFIELILQELSNQDPFEPQDTGALLEQLNSLKNIESQQSLQDELHNLLLQTRVSAAGGLIGRLVSGLSEANHEVEGLVTSVRVADNGSTFLELDTGATLTMDKVREIADATP